MLQFFAMEAVIPDTLLPYTKHANEAEKSHCEKNSKMVHNA
jgi:hypothetical protein